MPDMTSTQQELVRTTWATLKPQALHFTDVLYEELFSAEPQLRILFEGPMDEQHRKLSDAIAAAVDRVGDPPAMDLVFSELGKRHEKYGVRPYHYEAMALAFDATLKRMLGVAYTPEVSEAWKAFVGMLTAIMHGIGQ